MSKTMNEIQCLVRHLTQTERLQLAADILNSFELTFNQVDDFMQALDADSTNAILAATTRIIIIK